ncbi:hypothetical protein ACSHT0_02635 [Tepidicaulis sp. LMO-SS28]
MTTADIFYLALVLSGVTLFALTLAYYSATVSTRPDEPGQR